MKIPSPVHIETICCIERVKTFTAAAVCLHTTQSAVSARIRDVEELLGVQLFKRNGRTVELTLDGRRFVETTAPLMQRLEDFIGNFHNLSSAAGSVRISVGSTSMGSVASMLKELQSLLPNISYEIEIQYASVMLRELELGKIDLAVFSMPAGVLDQEKSIHLSLGFEPIQWVIASDLLAAHQDPDADDIQILLDTCPLWCVPRSTAYFELAIDSIRSRGGIIRRLNTSGNMPATLEVVRAGGGIGLLTDRLSAAHMASGALAPAFRDLHLPPIEHFIACSRDRYSPLLEKIMAVAASSSDYRMRRQSAPADGDVASTPRPA